VCRVVVTASSGLEAQDLVDLVLAETALVLRGGEHEVTDEPDLVLELLVVQRRVTCH
jgi:hypothetical protein